MHYLDTLMIILYELLQCCIVIATLRLLCSVSKYIVIITMGKPLMADKNS